LKCKLFLLASNISYFTKAVEDCVDVKPGIGQQYIYRSLYVAQLNKCMWSISKKTIKLLISENLNKNPEAAICEIASELGLNCNARETKYGDIETLKSINRLFPSFERQTGWQLRSSYSSMDPVIERRLYNFFRRPNSFLGEIIKHPYE